MTDHVCPRCGAGHSSRPDPDYEDAAQEDAMSADAKLCPREPDEPMQQAGLAAMFDETGDLKLRELYKIVRKGWRAMYDAAPAPAAEPDAIASILDEMIDYWHDWNLSRTIPETSGDQQCRVMARLCRLRLSTLVPKP